MNSIIRKLIHAYYFTFGTIAAVFIVGASVPRILHSMFYTSQIPGIGADTIVNMGLMTADQLSFSFAVGYVLTGVCAWIEWGVVKKDGQHGE